MTPDPHPALLDQALEFDVAAKIAFDKGDAPFAEKLALKAFHLRMQARSEVQNHEADRQR